MLTKEEMPACPVATTVALIGSKWKLLIMRNLLIRPWRFNELKKSLDGISQKVLTDSLRSMEEDGLVTVSYTHLDVYKRQAYQKVVWNQKCRQAESKYHISQHNSQYFGYASSYLHVFSLFSSAITAIVTNFPDKRNILCYLTGSGKPPGQATFLSILFLFMLNGNSRKPCLLYTYR